MSGAGSEIILRSLARICSQKWGGSTAGLVEQYWTKVEIKIMFKLTFLSP